MPTPPPPSAGAEQQPFKGARRRTESRTTLGTPMPPASKPPERQACHGAAPLPEPVMTSHSRRVQRAEVTVKYSRELTEDLVPPPGKTGPALAPYEYVRVRKWHITRVLCFFTGIAALCLGAVILSPRPAVEATAAAVLAASAGLCNVLLAPPRRRPGKTKVRAG